MEKTGFSKIIQDNKNEMNKIKDYKKEPITTNKRDIIFGICIVILLFFIGLFAMQIITGAIALVVSLIVGVGIIFGIKVLKSADPIIQQKLKNAELKIMFDEARKNATYQLDNQVIKNSERMLNAREARNKMGGMIESLRSAINPANEGKPNYEKKMKMLNKVESAYEQIKTNLVKGAESNKLFAEKVKDYKDMEKFANMASQAMEFFKEGGGSELEEMLSLESFGHIEDNFNSAMSTIENSTQDMAID